MLPKIKNKPNLYNLCYYCSFTSNEEISAVNISSGKISLSYIKVLGIIFFYYRYLRWSGDLKSSTEKYEFVEISESSLVFELSFRMLLFWLILVVSFIEPLF